jgi:hypothetical protein
VSFGSRAAVPTTLAARPVYPRQLTTLSRRPTRQPWANNGHHGIDQTWALPPHVARQPFASRNKVQKSKEYWSRTKGSKAHHDTKGYAR